MCVPLMMWYGGGKESMCVPLIMWYGGGKDSMCVPLFVWYGGGKCEHLMVFYVQNDNRLSYEISS